MKGKVCQVYVKKFRSELTNTDRLGMIKAKKVRSFMKKLLLLAMLVALLVGCAPSAPIETTAEATQSIPVPDGMPEAYSEKEIKARNKEAKENGTLTVVVDPGHGIADPGAMHAENLGEVTEADLTRAIADKLADALTARGYTVIVTHDGKTAPAVDYDDGKAVFGPSERAYFSNARDAHLFVSVHCDSFPTNADVGGTRLYYPVSTPYSTKQDKAFAKALKKAIEAAFPEDKDVSLMDMHGQDCYTVLYKTRVPSVLVECGFITNKGDAQKLLDTAWQDSFATALADGIDKYFE